MTVTVGAALKMLAKISYRIAQSRALRVALIGLLVATTLMGCNRTRRPFAGDDKIPADAPSYTIRANPNGAPLPNAPIAK